MMTLFKKIYALVITAGLVVAGCANETKQAQSKSLNADHPNIILVMTDDQGYGDVGVLGNPLVNTPHIDAMHAESVRLTDFHVDPTCSPTRAALMTGQYSMEAGVWHTVMGRSLLPTEKVTLAEHLELAGYKTAMFGKWHLGDNYPFRPEDQGFQTAVTHGGGGVGQTPDYWGNTQFNDTYYVNSEPVKFEGNATDIWFDQAEAFVKNSDDAPVFAYVSLNSPHTPWRAPEDYIQPYRDIGYPAPMANFYGMITHLDERVGDLREIADNMPNGRPTYFIFMTDNGSSFSYNNRTMGKTPDATLKSLLDKSDNPDWVENDGMRGYKSSVYEGGHRVPFFITGPDLPVDRDVDVLSAHFDVLPTLLDLANVPFSYDDLNGKSLAPFITSAGTKSDWDRTLIVTNQRVFIPSIERPMSVMTERWRYVVHGGQSGTVELFDIIADPSQTADISEQHPDVVAELTEALERWWSRYDLEEYPTAKIPVGMLEDPEVRLTSMDWMEANHANDVAWFPNHPIKFGGDLTHGGWRNKEARYTPFPWYLDAQSSGRYKVELYLHDRPANKAIGKSQAVLLVNDERYTAELSPSQTHATFDVPFMEGFMKLTGWFQDDTDDDTQRVPTFYTYVSKAE
ncbi:MAG: arylsulfatase [Litorimonas sp.]